eukprot:15105005-Alexandrium_andersonii.AAC.1
MAVLLSAGHRSAPSVLPVAKSRSPGARGAGPAGRASMWCCRCLCHDVGVLNRVGARRTCCIRFRCIWQLRSLCSIGATALCRSTARHPRRRQSPYAAPPERAAPAPPGARRCDAAAQFVPM